MKIKKKCCNKQMNPKGGIINRKHGVITHILKCDKCEKLKEVEQDKKEME